MRFAIWCSVVLVGCVIGCRQHPAKSAAKEHPQATGTISNEPAPPVPAEAAHGGALPEQPSGNPEGVVDLNRVSLTAPAVWTQKPTSSSFIAAEFTLPRAKGDDADGRLTVSTAGGSVDANIDRWKGQFQPKPTAAKQDVVDVAGLQVTIVDLSGEYDDQRGPFAPAVKRPGYRMIGAVIPVNGQLYFVKATGPEKTIAANEDAIQQFIRSVRPKK
ncbi:MAG TPA: hypothetical protein VHE81_21290 [Lacipirellulaceae bacterium]|nr:hypothetical protein [Lacipirellulaceae bacterium]